MNNEQFENLRESFLSKEAELLEWKGGEYGSYCDRLLNFKEIANFVGLDGTAICLLYLLKHIQSITSSIKNNKHSDKWFWQDEKGEGLKQRIADARNYLLLLAACIEEEANTDKNENIN